MSYYGSLEISHISFIFPSHSRIYFPSVNQMKMTKRLIVSFGILFWCFIATVLQITEAPRTITHTHTTQSFLELVCALCVVQVVPVPPTPSHLNSITPSPDELCKVFGVVVYLTDFNACLNDTRKRGVSPAQLITLQGNSLYKTEVSLGHNPTGSTIFKAIMTEETLWKWRTNITRRVHICSHVWMSVYIFWYLSL